MTTQTLLSNARILSFGGDPSGERSGEPTPANADALLIEGEHIAWLGSESAASELMPNARRIDLGGATVLPGFVDGHAHVIGTGQASLQVDLWGASSLAEIQQRIGEWAREHPTAPWVMAQGWNQAAIPAAEPHRSWLDAVVPDRPVVAQTYDYHSIWLNSAALASLGITSETVAPEGGRIAMDADGPTGYIDETAMQQLVWPQLEARQSDSERAYFLEAVQRAYAESGVTSATDMAMAEADLAVLEQAERAGELSVRVRAFWRVDHFDDPELRRAQLQRAIELAARGGSQWLRVVGIKLFVDGTIDGCTAALSAPYANGSHPDPIWSAEELTDIVTEADAAGLQIAMHAIGDEAVHSAIDALEHAVAVNGPAPRRHRIEHLELVSAADIARLARLGITASMQPVHADPAIQANWRRMLGDERIERGFAWREVSDAGARLVFGTDSPTSPYPPLPNMYVATTRESALDPQTEANHPALAVPIRDALQHATADAAWACGSEHEFGHLAPGMLADCIVLDREVCSADPAELLQAQLLATIVGGRVVYASAAGRALGLRTAGEPKAG